MQAETEIGIAAATQLGTLIWFLAAIRSDLRNLTGWVNKIDQRGEDTAKLTATLKGHLESLPCARCAPKITA